MDFFRPSAVDANLPLYYVLPPSDREAFEATLAALKRTLVDVDVSFERTPWADLRRGLGTLQQQVEAARIDGLGGGPSGGPRTDLARRDAARGTLVRQVHGGHGSIQAFQHSTTASVAARRDAALTDAHAKLLAVGKQGDQGKQAAADYFAQFLPSDEEVAREDPGVLRRLFNSLAAMLKRFLASLSKNGEALWGALADPDAYYRRLRGELHELAARQPEFALLGVVMFVPDLFRLYVRLLWDERVATKPKLDFAQALAYLVLPVDLIPEGIVGPAGYADDVYILVRVLAQLISRHAVSRELLLQHWSGEPRQLDALIAFATFADENIDAFRIMGRWFDARRAGVAG